MAGQGGGAAYQRLTTPDDGLSRSLQYWGGLYNQQAQQNREREDKEKIRKQKEVSDWEEKNQVNYDDFKQTITGYNTYDDVGRSYAQKAMDAYVEQYNKAEEAMKNGKTKEMQSYRNNMLKIKGTFGQIKDMNVALSKRNAEYEDLVAKGKMSGVDKDTWEAQNYALLGKNMDIGLDQNFNPVVKGITNLDDPNGQESPFEIPYNQMVNGNWRAYQRQELVGKDGLIPTVLGTIGTYEEVKRKNGNIITSNLWTDNMTQATKSLINPMVKSDEVMADLTNQFDPSSKKRTGFTDEERNAMTDKLSGMVQDSFKEKYKEEWDKDYAALQETKRHNKSNEDIGRSNAASNKQRADNDSKRTAVYGYRAKTDRIKAENERERNTPDLKIGTAWVDKVKIDGKYQNVPMKNYQVFTKDNVVQPIILGATKDKDGNTIVTKASSVDVSSDGTLMRLQIEGRKEPMYISRKGNTQSKALFEKIETQLGDRDVKEVNLFGAENTSPIQSSKPTKNKKMTVQEIQNKYNIN
jgi:hypothetical protein